MPTVIAAFVAYHWAARLFAAGVVVGDGLAAKSASAMAGLPRPVPKLGPFEIDHQRVSAELTDTSYPQKAWK